MENTKMKKTERMKASPAERFKLLRGGRRAAFAACLMASFLLNGCVMHGDRITYQDGPEISAPAGAVKASEVFNNYPEMSDDLKNDITHLNRYWDDFKLKMRADKDYSEDFASSVFLYGLKNMLSEKESFKYSATELAGLINQSGMTSMKQSVGSYDIELISYAPDIYNTYTTDYPLKSKYIFIRCTDGVNYYFSPVAEKSYSQALDFYAFENEAGLNIALVGRELNFRFPLFIKAYRLGENGFEHACFLPDCLSVEGFDIVCDKGFSIYVNDSKSGGAPEDYSIDMKNGSITVYGENEMNIILQ